MDGAYIGALVYLLAGAVFYISRQTFATSRGLLAEIALALFWPLTLVGLILWSFFGGEDADL